MERKRWRARSGRLRSRESPRGGHDDRLRPRRQARNRDRSLCTRRPRTPYCDGGGPSERRGQMGNQAGALRGRARLGWTLRRRR